MPQQAGALTIYPLIPLNLAPPSPPPPLFRQQVVCLSESSCVSPVQLSDVGGGRNGGGARSYDGEKALSSINHSVVCSTILYPTYGLQRIRSGQQQPRVRAGGTPTSLQFVNNVGTLAEAIDRSTSSDLEAVRLARNRLSLTWTAYVIFRHTVIIQ